MARVMVSARVSVRFSVGVSVRVSVGVTVRVSVEIDVDHLSLGGSLAAHRLSNFCMVCRR